MFYHKKGFGKKCDKKKQVADEYNTHLIDS